jgi:hypothetical protein
MIFVVVTIVIFVAIFPHVVAVPVCLVAIAVSISIPRYLPAAVPPPVVSVMVVSSAVVGVVAVPSSVIGIVVVSAAVISIMIVPDNSVPEAQIISEARFILASPFPIFPLAFSVEPVVFNIVIPALGQPFPVIWVVRSVIAVVPPVSVIGIVSIMVLGASRG